jgi:hypothetical protein
MRRMLFFDGRMSSRALPVVFEYIRPNVYPKNRTVLAVAEPAFSPDSAHAAAQVAVGEA